SEPLTASRLPGTSWSARLPSRKVAPEFPIVPRFLLSRSQWLDHSAEHIRFSLIPDQMRILFSAVIIDVVRAVVISVFAKQRYWFLALHGQVKFGAHYVL